MPSERVREHLATCQECAAAHAELAGHPRPARPRGRRPARRTRSRSHPRSRSACWTASRASASSARAQRRWRPRIALGAAAARWRARRSPSPLLVFGLELRAATPAGPPSQYRLAFEPIGPAPANASARAGLRTTEAGHRRAPVGQQPARRAGDVYEVFCDAPGWSASAGTFRVDAQGNALRDPHDRGQEGPVRPDPPRPPRAHRRAARSRPTTSSARSSPEPGVRDAYPLL